MKLKKRLSIVAAVAVFCSLAACGNGANAVYVQSVRELNNFGGIAPGDRFPGMVVSENTTEIDKDGDKSIEKLHVKEGQDVKEGEVLFSYDTEQLQLALDKQRLEKEQLEASIENYQRQIADLEKQRKKVKESAQLQYTVTLL